MWRVILVAGLCCAIGSANAQLLTTFAGGKAGGSGPPPSCAGALDLSTGCGTPQIGIR